MQEAVEDPPTRTRDHAQLSLARWETMTIRPLARIAGTALIITALGLTGVATASAAPTAVKKITCYKGTAKKVVTTAKCPKGWSLKKATSTLAFAGTYKGKLSTVWSSSGVQATEVIGTSTDAKGLANLSATGGSAPQAQCAVVNGTATLKGTDGSVTFKLDSSAKGCATDSAAPTTVIITGTATIISGTGKFVGATGVLTIKGQFDVTSSAAGTKETQAFSATFTGNIKLK